MIAPGPAGAADAIFLPPLFAHNMVLQKGAKNLIWGKSTGRERVWVSYKTDKNPSPSGTPDKAGFWQVELDLRTVLSPEPDNLVISVGKKDQQREVQVLTNVVVGDVLLLGVLGKGVPPQLPPEERLRAQYLDSVKYQLQNLRFTSLPKLGSMRNACAASPATWTVCAAEPATLEQLSALAFVWTVHLGKSPIGIIQTEPPGLVQGLRRSFSNTALENGRQKHLAELNDECLPAYHFATNSVGLVQQRRRAQLIQAKHEGLATNIPAPIQYEEPHARLKEEFDEKQPPAALLTFDAAVW
ncbi:MAG TPA: hypothetical protein VNT26_09085 [Candidatus Sulfotelmatobacter sp.]|nr:hypothetical protein [Candidatus Sulfotelmatobacter sp.]